ncbi:MAG: type III-B CRISPR module-associated protein Cmr5 [Thermomicrobiales bacterium]
MTRQQQDLARALDHISQLEDDETLRKTYGSLCHGFPILIRTNGLCQTLAFCFEKKSGDDVRARAYQRLWSHIAATLGHQNEATLLNHVRQVSNAEYLFYTRRLMEAWVYYKRFAVSLLGVTAGEQDVQP